MNNKQTALDFLNLVVTGNIDEAYSKYVDMTGKHHNQYHASDFASLRDGMKENHDKFPHKKLTVKNAVTEGDLVMTHSHVVLEAVKLELSVVHIFKFSHGKIIEMWDVGQQLQKDSPNEDGAF